MKIRILRGITIGDPPVHTPGKGDPPTFAPGDIVEVERPLAERLIGNCKAEYVVDEPEEEVEEVAEIEAATVEPPEVAVEPRARGRRG